uniref:Hemoglobin beta embryonic-2 n=1 Tax=Sinocyclocheilus grahami TaxID=75366 RepID=A0A672K8X6_SINGR
FIDCFAEVWCSCYCAHHYHNLCKFIKSFQFYSLFCMLYIMLYCRALVVYRWKLESCTITWMIIKNTYAELSVLHSEKLHEDPDNFRVFLADCLTIVIAATMGTSFTADVQAAWQKFLAVVVSALRRQYH